MCSAIQHGDGYGLRVGDRKVAKWVSVADFDLSKAAAFCEHFARLALPSTVGKFAHTSYTAGRLSCYDDGTAGTS